ncbi:hypothetical protein C171_24265 [Paenibacillus sp. FSL H8-237]|nr:hypothetical protein [Paenibacillus odorifer]ETT49444.1 hypothetical protein C171_24265 [Paenibacillus sp. FSL H8-237]
MANLGKALRSAGYSSLFVAIRSLLEPLQHSPSFATICGPLQLFAAIFSLSQTFADICSHLRADPCSPWTLSDEGI